MDLQGKLLKGAGDKRSVQTCPPTPSMNDTDVFLTRVNNLGSGNVMIIDVIQLGYR